MGSSGCGKTTLISCIVGVQSLERGTIEVFDECAGRNNIKVGYMPQEIALVAEFSIKEMINLYGVIYGMEAFEIKQRLNFLTNLLDLPDNNKAIGDCSGGQQRRVSFALTLLHEPELLILDEPTVGVDPLLRSKIWDYLVEITKTKNVTVLLSTHYIEEARQSTCVGLMRNGVMVAEDTPHNILRIYETTRLEEAFFKMSQKQEAETPQQTNDCIRRISKVSIESFDKDAGPSKPQNLPKYKKSNAMILQALLKKNFIQFLRHPG